MPSCQWSEDPNNPVYNPLTTPAYYQTVRYSSTGFAPDGPFAYYKMWYDYASAGGFALALSPDGINWTFNAIITGLAVTTGRHSLVLYDAAGFGIGAPYRMWYWNSAIPYIDDPIIVRPLRTAQSVDGLSWTNDTTLLQNPVAPLLQPLPAFNRGSYGAMDLLYFANNPAVLDLANPFNNRYVMYYDITQGGPTQVALAVSVDGFTWSKVGPLAVIPYGSGAGTWDQFYAASRGRVLRLAPNDFIAWYSGGVTRSSEGIGCATSADGVNWTKSAVNPVFSINDGVQWRNSRTYNAWALYDQLRFNDHGDPVCYKFWLSGSPTTNPGDLSIGYATNDSPCETSVECLLVASDSNCRLDLGLDTPNGPNNPIPASACHDVCVQEVTMTAAAEVRQTIPYPPLGPCRLGLSLPLLAPDQQCSLFVICADEALGSDCGSVVNTIGLLIVCTSESGAVVVVPSTLTVTYRTFYDFPSCARLFFSEVQRRLQEIDGSCKIIQLKAAINADGSAILVDGKVIDKLWKHENLWFDGLRPYDLDQAQRDQGFTSITVSRLFTSGNQGIYPCSK